MGEPVVFVGKGLIDTVVEVLVVGEDDMTSDIVELYLVSGVCIGLWRLTKPSFVTSVDARPPGILLESMIIHEGPF